ncbi:hypothetical protein OROMI_004939 [Orobanche minor]
MPSDQALLRLDESARFSMTMQISTLHRHRALLHCFHYQMSSYYHYRVNEIAAPLFQSTPPSQFWILLSLMPPALICCILVSTSSDRNARKPAVYSSMNADKKASLLLARRTASEQFSYNSATCLVCKLLQQQTFGKSCLIRIFQSDSTLWAPPYIAWICPCCDLHIEYVMFNKISKWCSVMEYVINVNVTKCPDPLLQPPNSDVQNY